MDKTRLYMVVGVCLCLAVVYLVLRAALDPITGKTRLDLTTKTNQMGQTICEQSLYCDSDSGVWKFLELAWFAVLLLVASVLAFQSLDVRQEFNETYTLVFMIYSRFVFAVLQLMTLFLQSSLSPQILFGFRTLIRGVDTTVSLIVYFLPKLYQAVKGGSTPSRNTHIFSRPRLSAVVASEEPGHPEDTRNESPTARTDDSHPLGQNDRPTVPPRERIKLIPFDRECAS